VYRRGKHHRSLAGGPKKKKNSPGGGTACSQARVALGAGYKNSPGKFRNGLRLFLGIIERIPEGSK
jgi:hypothetical protein